MKPIETLTDEERRKEYNETKLAIITPQEVLKILKPQRNGMRHLDLL